MNIAKIIAYLFLLQFGFCYDSFSQNPTKAIVLDNDYWCIPNVEIPAAFPGGAEELQKTLNKNLIYPLEAIKNNYGGSAVIQFVVNKEGAIKEPKLMQGACLYYGLGVEALRIVSNMPKWMPGEQNGRRVSYRYWLQLTLSTQSQTPSLAIEIFTKYNNQFASSDSSCNKVLFW